ncbi:S1 family peptidase [Lentzea sp. E54]|uniref:S1 family peptidase n=1 Tax=Lentzea xerophila TaxID=3435883 RepID=UPI003DA398DC
MKKFLAALVSLAVLVGLATPAQAVIGGTVSTYGPWAVRMLVNGEPFCTATAVAPNWILGADHCFRGFDDSELSFRVGNLDQRLGREIRPIPGTRRGNPHTDMMLIEVPAMNVPVLRLADPGDDPVGAPVTVYGWGATCGDEGSCQSDVLRQAEMRILPMGDQRCVENHFSVPGGPDICIESVHGVPAGGDSGGPVVLTRPDGVQVLVAVLAYGDRVSLSSGGEIAQQREWIRSVIGEG